MIRLALFLLLATAATAQPWGATASTSVEAVGDRGTWLESRVAAGGRLGDHGAGFAEAGRVERYDQAAAFVGADLYPVLAEGVYANVRARWAPETDVSARLDVGAEVFVGVGAWEASAGARRLAFADRAVLVATASGARYAGPWLIRATLAAVPDDGQLPLSARLTLRHFDGDGEGGAFGSFWEVSAGRGQEATVEAAGQTAIRDAWTVAGRLQRPVSRRLGLSLGAGYTADGDLSRPSAEAGVFVRW